MAIENLYWKTLKYLESKGKDKTEFKNNIILQNDGDDRGNYINTWNVSGVDKPTDDQLNALASSATTESNNHQIRKKRRREYGDIGEQLDLLYKDIVADKLDTTGEWAKKIKAVKDANAKE